MNELELKEATSEYAIYFYKPEGKGSRGEIRMNVGDEEASIIKKSDEDTSGRYAHKATIAVKRCVDKKNLPMKFTQAWV